MGGVIARNAPSKTAEPAANNTFLHNIENPPACVIVPEYGMLCRLMGRSKLASQDRVIGDRRSGRYCCGAVGAHCRSAGATPVVAVHHPPPSAWNSAALSAKRLAR